MLSYNVKIFPYYQEKEGLCVLMPWAHCMSPIMYVFIVNCYHYLKYFVVYNNNIIAGIWKLKKNLSVHQASWCCHTSSSNSASVKIFTAIFIISLFVITFGCCNIYSIPLQGLTLSLDPTSFFIIREINERERLKMKLFHEKEYEFELISSSGPQIFVVLFLLNVYTVLLGMSVLTDFISFK